MKKRTFLAGLLLLFFVEMAVIILFVLRDTDNRQDSVLVNETVQSVQSDWNTIETHKSQTSLDYTVMEMEGELLFQTKEGLSDSINIANKTVA